MRSRMSDSEMPFFAHEIHIFKGEISYFYWWKSLCLPLKSTCFFSCCNPNSYSASKLFLDLILIGSILNVKILQAESQFWMMNEATLRLVDEISMVRQVLAMKSPFFIAKSPCSKPRKRRRCSATEPRRISVAFLLRGLRDWYTWLGKGWRDPVRPVSHQGATNGLNKYIL